MTTGALIFAHNNASIDYVKLAIFAATRVSAYLGIPVSLVTDNIKWVTDTYPDHGFDQIIEIPLEPSTPRCFHDGTLSSKKMEWKNATRSNVYNITPYDTTLVLDSDYILNSDVLKNAFDIDTDLQIYHKSLDLASHRDTDCFTRINQQSIPFYWATVFVFRKSQIAEAFFDLVTYVKQNWSYFKILYSIDSGNFRNDFAFSIAIHIMNGKTNGEFVAELPGTMTYCLDTDILISIDNDIVKVLVEKENTLGEYLAVKTKGIDVHVMNKASLGRFIDGGYGV
mgnify:CR=1 FL=1